MTYTIGDRRIDLSLDSFTAEDEQLIVSHKCLFKFCLNNATLKALISVKKVLHLYGDIITIYATLLRKITNYDDITAMTTHTMMSVYNLESKLNSIFGTSIQESDIVSAVDNWQYKHYETTIKRLAGSLVKSAHLVFVKIVKNLNCIELFFQAFNNLKKLLIPYLVTQTTIVEKSLDKLAFLFGLSTIADHLCSVHCLTPSITKQLKKIEKITSGIEKESLILDTSFKTFDPALQQYTNVLLGKAILKRDISAGDCQLIKRRSICYQTAEHVISIPLTEDHGPQLSMRLFTKYMMYVVGFLAVLVVSMLYRLFRVLFSG